MTSVTPLEQEVLNRTWTQKDSNLLGFTITLLIADITLLGCFLYKIFYKKKHQIFGNQKTTPNLDKVITFTLILLVLQSIVCLNMILISKSVTHGLTCSISNLFFHTLHSLLKIMKFFIIFLHYYIWIKQRLLGFLQPHGDSHTFFKMFFVFILSVSVIIPFKMNIDTTFVLIDGLCFGKTLSFKKTLSFISIMAAFAVVIFLICVQIYYLFRTKQEENKHISNEKAKIVFKIVRKQVCLFLVLHIIVATLLALYFGKLKLLHSDGMIEFANLNYFARHLYNFVFCSVLCIFRCITPKLDIKSEFLNIKKENFVKN